MNKEESKKQLMTFLAWTSLDEPTADRLFATFEGFFDVVAEWEERAIAFAATNKSQIETMKIADTSRRFLKKELTFFEIIRKKLKRKCIDEIEAVEAIANMLKDRIKQIDEHLEEQGDHRKKIRTCEKELNCNPPKHQR